MQRGLYRTTDAYLGECARVSDWAGDASPYLSREMYRMLKFVPDFDDLPTMDEYENRDVSWAA